MVKQKILTVDDDPDILDLLRITLQESYDVIAAANGEEALAIIRKESPHLVITDYKMPKVDGLMVCRELKKDILLRHLPVIMLTARGDVIDKVRGIDAGADDYLVKPFEPAELLARVRMILRRTEEALDANPLTRLPGNVSIYDDLEKRLKLSQPFAACYLDIDKFKAFNDKYGFEKGDEVIKETGRILLRAVQHLGDKGDFVGHIGGDDFVYVISPQKVELICSQIMREFDKSIINFYCDIDRAQGYIISNDRDGATRKFNIMTVSIGVVKNNMGQIRHVAQVAEIGAELKKLAKQSQISNFITG